MWIVRLALRRPYTVAVMAALILLTGTLSARRMVVDVFPVIDIPVVIVIWNYPGLSAEDMERRVTFITERAFSTTVPGIEHIESQSIPSLSMLRVYFEPGTDVGAAIAQMNSVTNTIVRILPPGMTPPNIIRFNASSVPVAQLTASSRVLSEERIFDYGLNFIRIKLFTIPGLATPAPFGGKNRQIDVDVDPVALAAHGLSPADVVSALSTSNVILPAGQARMGRTDYGVFLNSSPSSVEELGRIPIRVEGGAPVTVGDVARVVDGFADQTNIVHVGGRRATYLAILRKADASTLAVVDATRAAIPEIAAVAPHGLDLKLDFDQSRFVRASISGVLREGVLAAVLVSLMVLVFLGDLRSVVLVCTSIPLAVLVGVVGLYLTGQSLNVMTLGGLSLAIGMLVDDATVEVENIHRNRGLGKPLTRAILDGAREVATPAIVATLSICIVFFPVALLVGPARYLFGPLALAVVFSMLASYVLSRTLVPSLARLLMPAVHVHPTGGLAGLRERAFARLVELYARALEVVLRMRVVVLATFAALLAVSAVLAVHVGSDFFPAVDTGLMKLHVRAAPGTRLEETERLTLAVEDEIHRVVPRGELDTINDMIGVPISYNLAFVQTDNVTPMDAEILVALRPGHRPTDGYVRALRERLPRRFPGATFYFMPADIVSQVINFGVPSPIDVQVESRDLHVGLRYARRLEHMLRAIPGVADTHLVQTVSYPALQVDVDRTRAAEIGLNQHDVAQAMLIGLSGSALASPNYFVNPTNNVNYAVVVKVPMARVGDVDALLRTPVAAPSTFLAPASTPAPNAVPGAPAPTLGSLGDAYPRTTMSQISHYTVQRVLDIAAGVDGRDLGSVAAEIDRAVAALGALPPGTNVHVRGQADVMRSSFSSLELGIVLAIVLVYLLMVVLFQSWVDPLVILSAVPGALAGVAWMLVATGSTFNVVSLMGTIMAVGIAVANSILLVAFANEARSERPSLGPVEAALLAAQTRLRPVLMTALAMVLGMLPTALGLGEAGEQNAPLGRAVIGGLLAATATTLVVVPIVYSLLRRAPPKAHRMDERLEREEREGLEASS